jgi:hypothetical protein
MNEEVERTWTEVVVSYFKVPSQNLSGGTMEKHEQPQTG